MIKKGFRWGGDRPLHLRNTQEVSNFNWGVLKYKELPERSDRLQQLGADCFVHKTTHRFAFGDDIVEVILKTSNIVAVVSILTVLKGHSNLIISDCDVVDSGGSELHDQKNKELRFEGFGCPSHLNDTQEVSNFNCHLLKYQKSNTSALSSIAFTAGSLNLTPSGVCVINSPM